MDRAQRRQRRLDQKNWRGDLNVRRGRPRHVSETSNRESTDPQGGRTNASEGESTDDIRMFDKKEEVYEQGSELDFLMADVYRNKWKTIAESRAQKISEYETEIDCLKKKIKEIAEGRQAPPASESIKLRAEIQALEETNKSLNERNLVTLERLSKQFSCGMEILRQAQQEAKGNYQNGHHQASKWNSVKIGHKSNADGNAGPEDQTNNGHRQTRVKVEHMPGNCYGSAPPANGEGPRQPSKKSTSSALSDSNSGADVDIDNDTGGQGAQDAMADNATKSEECYDPGRSEQLANDGSSPKEVSEALFSTAAERKAARELVGDEFMKWLNKNVRRPTPTEMSYHKSQLLRRPRGLAKDSFTWVGITGSSLLQKFIDYNGGSKPTNASLTSLLRETLRVEGTKRGNEMLWCLVWADCTHHEQLPGYARHAVNSKRVRL